MTCGVEIFFKYDTVIKGGAVIVFAYTVLPETEALVKLQGLSIFLTHLKKHLVTPGLDAVHDTLVEQQVTYPFSSKLRAQSNFEKFTLRWNHPHTAPAHGDFALLLLCYQTDATRLAKLGRYLRFQPGGWGTGFDCRNGCNIFCGSPADDSV